MTTAAAIPTPTAAIDRLQGIIRDLQGGALARARDFGIVALLPIINIAFFWLQHMRRRAERWGLRFHAGTLTAPKPPKIPAKPRAAKPAQPDAKPRKPRVQFPKDAGWVIRAISFRSNEPKARLEELLADPALLALLTTAPQVGRILRPLCRSLDIPLIPELKLPRRRRKPRVAQPKPEHPPPAAVAPPPPPVPPLSPQTYAGDYSHLVGPTDPGFVERLKAADRRRRERFFFRGK